MSNSHPSLFDSLGEKQLEILLRSGQRKVYEKNTLIIEEGEKSNCAYIINSGKVKIFLSDENGKRIVLNVLHEKGFFGEMSLIDQEERSAAAMAMEETELTVISQKSFRESIQAHPEIAEWIMRGLVARLRDADKKISSLALQDVQERVASMLYEMARNINGQLVIEEKPTHQHIANTVGSSREMITRILKHMGADGRIRIDGNKIYILDITAS
jgi:CRP/FNR family cyclic AMP-dependent transcriptional regulator